MISLSSQQVEKCIPYLQFLCEAEVDQLDVADGVEEQVLGLEVAVDDAPAVQVVEGLHHAGRVEPRRGVVKVTTVSATTKNVLIVHFGFVFERKDRQKRSEE